MNEGSGFVLSGSKQSYELMLIRIHDAICGNYLPWAEIYANNYAWEFIWFMNKIFYKNVPIISQSEIYIILKYKRPTIYISVKFNSKFKIFFHASEYEKVLGKVAAIVIRGGGVIQYKDAILPVVLRPPYLHNGISYTGKMTSLYWIRALILNHYLGSLPFPLELFVTIA